MIAKMALGVNRLMLKLLMVIMIVSTQAFAGGEYKDDRDELAGKFANKIKRNYSGDRIYVSGEVAVPTTFDLKKLKVLNLQQALNQCGGQLVQASSIIFIIRDSKIHRVALNDGDIAKVMLDGGDLIFVPHKKRYGR